MCDNRYILKENTIKNIYKDVFENDSEKCAYFTIDNENILTIDPRTITKGEDTEYKQGKTRKFCNYSETNKTNYIYHSHPKESRSYPSVEDVLKVLKYKDKYRISVISTRWGIYIIKPSIESIKIATKYNKEQIVEIYNNPLKRLLDKIGKLEDYKGFKNRNYTDIKIEEQNYIIKYMNNITDLTKLKTKFCHWSQFNL